MPRAVTLNEIAASDPSLANNPYLRGLGLGYPTTNNSHTQNSNKNRKRQKNSRQCENKYNEWIIEMFKEKLQSVTGNKKATYKLKYSKANLNKAIKNIKICPLRIQNEHMAQEIDGIGVQFARMIKKKLIDRNEYLSQDPNQARFNMRKEIESNNNSNNKKKRKPRKSKPNKVYEPKTGSGGYALLLHMYTSYLHDNKQGFGKQELMRDAQQYTTSSFTDPRGTYYTAWNSMAKLIEHHYVQSISRGHHGSQYYLQPDGRVVAARIYAKHHGLPAAVEPHASTVSNHGTAEDGDDEERKTTKYKFQCEYCDKKYVRETALKSHVEKKHPNGTNAKPRPNLLPIHHGIDGMNVDYNTDPNPKKRKCNEMMELDEEIQRLSKRPRRESFSNVNNIKYDYHDFNQTIASRVNKIESLLDVRKPLQIGNELYALNLIYDTSEENKRGRNERVRLENQFYRNKQIIAKPKRLSIGDFVWTLQSLSDSSKQYLYPVLIERKRKDDLISSLKDNRYSEQKWRMKKNAPHFRHIYLIEDYHIDQEYQKKQLIQALIGTEVRDQFMIYHTKSLLECIECLSKWTFIIYEQILMKLKVNENKYDYDFFRAEKCLDFESFNSSIDSKKNYVSSKILFGRQLMGIPQVTDVIASLIIQKYPTNRCLIDAWDECENEDEQKLLLHKIINGTCLDKYRDLDSGELELDQDLLNVINSMDVTSKKPISKKLSEKMWQALYE